MRSAWLGSLILGALLVVLTGSPRDLSARGAAQTSVDTPATAQADAIRVIGPGKVTLKLGPQGRWLGLVPSWTNGRSLFAAGGIAVYAEDSSGELREVASTSRGLEKAGRAPSASYHEGIRGGFRAPSGNADDDRDGRANEDRVDGIDNDGDGRVDEDFAAVGDQMVVCEYRTPVPAGPTLLASIGPVALAFHQEAYAWSLPHIDGAIMLNLWIQNRGLEPLRNLHVAAFIDKAAPFVYADRMTYAGEGGHPVEARAVVLTDPGLSGGSSVALLGFPRLGDAGRLWSGGYVGQTQDLLGAVRGRAAARHPDEDPNALTSPFDAGDDVDAVETEIAGDRRVVVFAVTPGIEALEPGEETLVQFALVATPSAGDMQHALSLALRTYIGDGEHRFLPPPVSMTPRILWGKYSPVAGQNGVAITLDDLGEDPVKASEISYISGVEPGLVDHSEAQPGVAQLVLRGEAATRLMQQQGRVTLKGRLDSGEFFEALLRPTDGSEGELATGPTEDADRFWRTPGRLDEDEQPGLLGNNPNPFRQSTTIHYEVPALIEQQDGATLRTSNPLETSVKIYDVRGHLVDTLVDEQVPPGRFSIDWDAVDGDGHPVASGVYYVKLQIGQKFITKRVTLLK